MTDIAGVLSDEQSATLADSLARFDAETGHQIAILIVPDLKGEPIETFACRVGNTWGVGRRELNTGILLVLAVQDRMARIEVADGFSPVIPDALAAEIMERDLLPAFRQQRYGDGLRIGINALMQAARQLRTPSAPEARQ